jgi:hypothetical protein
MLELELVFVVVLVLVLALGSLVVFVLGFVLVSECSDWC